jgi:hypothetical protein
LLVFLAILSCGAHAWPQQGFLPGSLSATVAAFPDAPEPQTAAGTNTSAAQQAPDPLAVGSVHGVVTDKDGAVCEGAAITLAQDSPSGPLVRTATSDSMGQFSFDRVPPGAFKLTISSKGFETQIVEGVLRAGESYQAATVVLPVTSVSEVKVTASQVEIATEQLKEEEQQRVLGVIPNFYVSYAPNAAPLTTRQKFDLAWKSSVDPVTFLATGVIAGAEQSGNTYSGYGQGVQGYAKRFGASYADNVIGTLIGGAILPAWWKQDPRYFYKGTGTIRSRAFYAIANAVVCKGDNGRWQVNYSGIVGGLAAGGISNLYYPASDRDGVALTFEDTAIGIGESALQNLLQEFVVKKLTPKIPNYGAGKP